MEKMRNLGNGGGKMIEEERADTVCRLGRPVVVGRSWQRGSGSAGAVSAQMPKWGILAV